MSGLDLEKFLAALPFDLRCKNAVVKSYQLKVVYF